MTQQEISNLISNEICKQIIDSPQFYFQKGQDALNKWLNLSINNDLKTQLIDLGKDYEKLKKAHNSNSEIKELIDLLFEITSYCDVHANEKDKYNKYEDKRTIAKASVRMHNWMAGLIKLKFKHEPIRGASIINAFNYLLDPQNNTTILSENHRAAIANNLFKQEYNPQTFVRDLKKYFSQYNIQISNLDNYTQILSYLIYEINKEWKDEVIGLMALDGTQWQDDYIKEIKDDENCIIWNSKRPSGTNKTIKYLKNILNENKSFPLYYSIGGYVYYKAEIIDFAESQEDLDNKEWNKKYKTLYYKENFTEYKDNKKVARIVFLAKNITKIDPIAVEEFEFFDGYNAPRQDNLSPIKEIPISLENKSFRTGSLSTLVKKPLNTILFGPPGTGKTYNSINKAISILDTAFDLTQDRKLIKKKYDSLEKQGQILFTTFHQSMSYEDFIEGIKPDEPKPNQDLSYSIQAGIFKKACANAGYLCYKEYLKSQKQTLAYSFDDLYDAFITSIQALLDNKSAPIYKTLRGRDVEIKEINSNDSIIARAKDSIAKSSAPLTKENLQKLYDKFKKIDDIEDLKQVKETVEITPRITEFYAVFGGLKEFEKTFKQNYNILIESSEVGTINFVENQKKYDAGVYNNSIKEFGEIADPVVLIIDEINRGNVSQIFGELITLIEDDKRLGKAEELEIILPYSKKKFSVPPNLYILGTMNTADRSVEALDTALRRRFVFEEIPPNYKLQELQYEFAGIKAIDILLTINKRIEKLLDKDHLIGHSYFILKEGEKPNEKLMNSFYKNIIPLLQEYFFGDFGKIGLVLGQGFVKLKNWDDNVDSFAEFEHESSSDFESKVVYEIIDYRESTNYEVNKVKMDFEKAIKRLMKFKID